MGHFRKNEKTCKLLMVALGCLQQEVGITTSVLETNFNDFLVSLHSVLDADVMEIFI